MKDFLHIDPVHWREKKRERTLRVVAWWWISFVIVAYSGTLYVPTMRDT
jgi:hypothetical protein